MIRMETIRRQARDIGIALLLIAVTTVVAYTMVNYLGIRRGSVVYMLAVLLAGWHLGLVPALVAAIAGVVCSGLMFYTSAQPSELLDLSVFLIVALVASHVANSMKQQTELARKRENEMSDLYAFSRRLAAAPSAADIYRAIEDHLATLAQRRVVLFGSGTPGTGEKPGDPAVPDFVRAAIVDVQSGSSIEANVRDNGATSGWCAGSRRRRPISA
jgi:two-component system sensor histidine kinase KdpD